MEVERALTSPSSSHWWGESMMLFCHGHSDRQWHWCFLIKTSRRTSSNRLGQIPRHLHFSDPFMKWMWHLAVPNLPLSPFWTTLHMSRMTQCILKLTLHLEFVSLPDLNHPLFKREVNRKGVSLYLLPFHSCHYWCVHDVCLLYFPVSYSNSHSDWCYSLQAFLNGHSK